MGPLLFNIFLNDLLLTGFHSKLNSYADDTQIFNISDDISQLHMHLQADLTAANSWFCSNGLTVNPEKCTAMWLGRCRDSPSFLIDSNVIRNTEEMKLLGVTLDKDLNFSTHVADIVRKVGNQIQVLQRHKNSIDVNTKIRLYNAYVLPHLTYCSIIWHYCGQRNSEKLEKLNQRALRFIYNDCESTYEELIYIYLAKPKSGAPPLLFIHGFLCRCVKKFLASFSFILHT